jgi:hypothetical protein
MSLSRAQVETILVKRCGALMTLVGMGITYAGSNGDLNDPIGVAVRRLGGTVGNPASVADADIATVTKSVDAILDVSELRLLENILGNYDDVDIVVGPTQERLSQNREGIEKRLDRLSKGCKERYGVDLPTIEAGLLDFDFAEHGETIV